MDQNIGGEAITTITITIITVTITTVNTITINTTWTAALLANNNPMPLSSPSYSIKIPFTFIRVVLNMLTAEDWNISSLQYWDI